MSSTFGTRRGPAAAQTSPQQRARLLHYLPAPPKVMASMAASQQRCALWRRAQGQDQQGGGRGQKGGGRGPHGDGRGQQSLGMGQLKAAEAYARIRSSRQKEQEVMSREVRQIVACQPTAQEALRLEILLQQLLKKKVPADCLNRAQRHIVQQIMADDAELTVRT